MNEEHPETEELRTEQLARERAERDLEQSAPREDETELHRRRADKAQYLRQKLEERAESEREATEEDPP